MTPARLLRSRLLAHVLIALSVAGTIGCDRVTKRLAVETLAGSPRRSFLADSVRLEYAENTGGFLSLGAAWPEHGRVAVFVVASGALMAALAVAMMRAPWDGRTLLGATLFLAGGASNWLDRVLHGHVVDFLNVGIGALRTGVFNVADIAIMLGLGLLLVAHVGRSDTV